MGVEENKENIRRLIEEVYNQGNMSAVDDLVANDHVIVGNPNLKGPEGIKQFATSVRTSFPDFHMKIDDMVAEGDIVATYLTWTGTQTGEWMNIPPTGKKITVSGSFFFKLRDGKEIESKGISQYLSMYQQLGVPPPTG